VGEAEILLRLAALNTAYARAIDTDRLEEWPSFFLERCVYRITSADNHRRGHAAGIVYADSRAMLADRIAALRNANIYERQCYRHIVGMPSILEADDNMISTETSFVIVRTLRDGRMDLFVAGAYLDRVRDEAGTLRFAERIVVCDSSRFDTLVAIPL
jgi:anthranilate 1,2-dioxygenase small subunit/terephthalate 1,2-dioxygenase oxygenase component beta subunit